MRIGIGYDSHRFEMGRPLILGGIEVPHEAGLAGHSDADVLLHSICDALLGAAAMEDIGAHFPDTDERYRERSSLYFLERVGQLLNHHRMTVLNIDATVITEAPRLRSYIDPMRRTIASTLGIQPSQVNIKAKTNERMGFVGRGEGMAAMAVALIKEDS